VETLGDGVLRLPLRDLDRPHQGELTRLEMYLVHQLAEAASRLIAELGKEEANGLARSYAPSALARALHPVSPPLPPLVGDCHQEEFTGSIRPIRIILS
jgi:hypothetical protein